MCSLSDIPVVGKAVDKISVVIVEAGTRGLVHLFCYKGVVKDLKATKINELQIQEESVARKAAAAKNNGQILLKHVVDWQEKVVEIKDQVKVFVEEYENRPSWLCCFEALRIPDPVTRFRLGRSGAKMSKRVEELIESGKELVHEDIAQYPPFENVPISGGDRYYNFESRRTAYGKIWEALVKEDGFSVLGIYGMPGVGKTRMMEQTWKEIKEKGVFDKVARANFGNGKLDVINIQEQLSFHLECHLESKDNEEYRAFQLRNSIMNGGKILFILDDVWRYIPLNRIGISFDEGTPGGCKILFTSRAQDVCLKNNCKDPVRIDTLTAEEAWEMFSNVVGSSKIYSLLDKTLAMRVCNKCARLPLLIVAVGNSVAIMGECQWKDALDLLENHKIEKIHGIEGDIFACVELSFNQLHEDEKIFLLLCSLYREDAEIDKSLLFKLATDCELLEGKRDRVHSIVQNLKSSSLLLPGRNDKYIRLHDIIRDVARSIASRQEYAFLSITCNSWLPNQSAYSTRKVMYLNLEVDNVSSPDDLRYPDMAPIQPRDSDSSTKYFVCCDTIVGGGKTLAERAENLFLTNVGTTNPFIDNNKGAFKDLRVLYMENCHYVENLAKIPGEESKHIQQLTAFSNLSVLNIVDCRGMTYLFSASVAQGLVQLQVLLVRNCPAMEVIIGSEGTDNKKVIKFAQLKSIVLKAMPKLKSFYGHRRYINSTTTESTDVSSVHPASLFDKMVVFPSLVELKIIMLKVASDVWGENDHENKSFCQLKFLKVSRCDELEIIFPLSMLHRLKNLEKLDIKFCSKLRNVMSPWIARDLVHLKVMRVRGCAMIKEIIAASGRSKQETDDEIVFPVLLSLELIHLPSLINFWCYESWEPKNEQRQPHKVHLIPFYNSLDCV
nr:PREDICTED: probable disease resistance protein At1g12280 [Daucus carota subsp. sativus]